MSTVDNRIVSIGFDNAAFEQKIASTMASLDKLKQSLDFTNSKRNVAELSSAAEKFNMGNMTSAIENVSGKFLALSTIAITVLANITSKAVDAGLSLIKAFTLAPIQDGFREMETNMNSIQTILSNTDSKGSTLEDVNKALETLNQYSDQTIYNFSEMARNIGTFTAAGVDLDTSVNAIKGIANLAAISGSNSQQASTAMYQLSQALATGSVKLMDWNSIVNAGMGGEVFQRALFETGKSLGTIADTNINTSFEEWTAAGNTFRGSLESGWLTADVLTNTLQAFTGDLTEAQLMSLGYTAEQAKEMARLGELGVAAATEVKTLTQLLGTVKESIGSGWSKSFQIIFGDFEEAKELFTGINDAIGAFVGRQADARNALLQGWKDLGGRTSLINGLVTAFHSLSTIMAPIKEAFREIFPPMTAERLFELTERFKEFMERLAISGETAEKVKTIFTGIFGALEIGWEIVKNVARVFSDLFSSLSESQGGKILDFFVQMGDKLIALNDALVEGGGITKFFDTLVEKLKSPLEFIDELKARIQDFFENMGGVNLPEGITQPIDRVQKRFEHLRDTIKGVINFFQNVGSAIASGLRRFFDPIFDILSEVTDLIKDWFHELGDKLAMAAGPEDFDAVVDAVNVGILGAIALLFKKFLDGGVGIDFGGGLFETLKKTAGSLDRSLGTLTNTLSAMQTEIKANALIKIAGAVGILTASVVVLSLIDSVALTKALTAMTIGFGQLIGAMTIMSKFSTGLTGAAGMTVLAVGMIALASAVLILSLAVRTMSGLDWEELGKGLTGVLALLGIIVVTAKLLEGSATSLAVASVGMVGIAIAMNLLAGAMKIFGTMSWEEMGKGFTGVAGGLLAIALAMHIMPKHMALQAAGLVAVGFALNLMAGSMKIFATMSWEEIGKGIAALAGGLLAIALAMNLMPMSLPITGAGLILVGIALNAMAGALIIFGSMAWDEIGRGLAALAGAMLILAVATNAMSGAVGGAIAIGIISISLGLLAQVLKEFAKMKLKDLGKGLLGMVGVLAALGLTAGLLSPLIPAMLGLGAAILVLGAGFALFGLGAQATALAIGMLAESGRSGLEVLMFAIDQILLRLPEMAQAFGLAILELGLTLLEGMGPLVTAVGVLIMHILDTIIELSPKVAETLVQIIHDALAAVREVFPDVVATGMEMLLSLLRGIRDNIHEITTTVVDIITGFLDALAEKVPEIIDSVYNLILAIIEGVVAKLGEIASFLLPKGVEFLQGLWDGIVEKSKDVMKWFQELPGNILQWIGSVITKLKQKGIDFLIGLLTGVNEKVGEVTSWFTSLPGNILEWIGGVLTTLKDKGKDLLQGLWNGAKDTLEFVKTWMAGLPGRLADAVGNLIELLVEAGKDVIRGLWNGILSMKDWLWEKAKGIAGWITSPFEAAIESFSPSRKFFEYGEFIGQGLINGIDSMQKATENASSSLGESVVNGFDPALESAVTRLPALLEGLEEFNPTITPILDLSLVRTEASRIAGILGTMPEFSTTFTINQAQSIASDANAQQEETEASRASGVTEIRFEQNNYSPEALSPADIYRQTRNQLAMAKEELAVL